MSGASTATRTVASTVRVNVPLFGRRVERWIVEGIGNSYEEEAARLSRWLDAM